MQVLLKKLRNKDFVIYILILILIFLTVYSYFGREPIQENKYYSHLEIGEISGFDVNNSALMFGSILPKGSASRKITVDNTYDFDILVKFLAEGDISDFFFKEDVLIKRGEVRDIYLSVVALEDSNKGFYDGNISVVIYRY